MLDNDGKILNTYELVFSYDGKIIAGTKDGITLYNSNDLTKIINFNKGIEISHIIFSNNNSLLATKCTLGTIRLYDLNELKWINTFKPSYKGDGSNIFFTPDDKFLIDGDWDGNLRIISLESYDIKIIKKYENSIINNIQYDAINRSFHILIHNKGEISYYRPGYDYFSIWNYEDSKFGFKYDTKYINRISNLVRMTYDYKRKRYLDIQKNRNNIYELIVVDELFSKIIKKVSLDVKSSMLTKIQFSPLLNILLIYIDKKIYIINPDEYSITKIISFDGNIRFSNDEKYISVCTSKGEGYITNLKKLLLL